VPRCRHRSPPQPTLAADRGVADASTDDIYAAMDWLADQQDDIEAKLARRHLAPEPNPARMELFDLSSSWLEGTRACGYGWLPGVEEGDDGQDALVGVQGGVDFELAEDAVDVLFHRTLRYPQGLGDPGVGLTLGHQLQHLSFS
jgi:hypothetical protein